MKPLGLMEIDLPENFLQLEVLPKGPYNDVGWALADLLTFYNGIVYQYNETQDKKYLCVLGKLAYKIEKSVESEINGKQ